MDNAPNYLVGCVIQKRLPTPVRNMKDEFKKLDSIVDNYSKIIFFQVPTKSSNSISHITKKTPTRKSKEENNAEPKSAQKQQQPKLRCKNCKNFTSWYQDVIKKHYELCIQENKNYDSF